MFEVHNTLRFSKHLLVCTHSNTTCLESVDGTKLSLNGLLVLVFLILQVHLSDSLLISVSSHLVATVELVRTADSLVHVKSIKLFQYFGLINTRS